MTPLTYTDFKEQVAKAEGYHCWDMCLAENDLNTITKVMNRAAQLYGDSQYNQGIEIVLESLESKGLSIEVIEELKKLKR